MKSKWSCRQADDRVPPNPVETIPWNGSDRYGESVPHPVNETVRLSQPMRDLRESQLTACAGTFKNGSSHVQPVVILCTSCNISSFRNGLLMKPLMRPSSKAF